MKSLIYLLAGAATALAVEIHAADEKPLASQKEKASYGVGINVGKSFKSDLIDLDTDAFFRGFKDALAGAKPAITEAELEQAMTALRADVSKKSEERMSGNKKAGEDFLAKNKSAKNVVTNGVPEPSLARASSRSNCWSAGARSSRPLADAALTNTEATMASKRGAMARKSSSSDAVVRSESSIAVTACAYSGNSGIHFRIGSSSESFPCFTAMAMLAAANCLDTDPM
jgi:hypothetical protein